MARDAVWMMLALFIAFSLPADWRRDVGKPRVSIEEAKRLKVRRMQRDSFRAFFQCYEPTKPYVYGRHTLALIDECQRATEAMERGECYYAIVCLPPRHGKSDVISRRYPVWHLLGHPDNEIILASHTADLAHGMCVESLRCFRRAACDFGLRPGKQRQNEWTVDGRKGKLQAMGLGGSITGKGAHLFIIDDYLKNRQEAESTVIRDHQWDSFQSDLWTRRAPVHAFIIVATRWHVDDLVGRLQAEHEKNTDFPNFKLVRFPAQWEDGSYLFPERFPKAYYESQKALGVYAWQSLFQNDPAPRMGNMLKANRVKIIRNRQEWKRLTERVHWRRGWDLASTEAERIKDDPDYTVGTKAGVRDSAVFIEDVVRGQWEAPQRNQMIARTFLRDGRGVTVRVESVAGYKDTFTLVRNALKGKAVVEKVSASRDKVANASVFEPSFEAGEVYILEGDWNDQWLAEVGVFPSGKHDDQVDSLHVAAGADLEAEMSGLQIGLV